jgi:hypothetical protein
MTPPRRSAPWWAYAAVAVGVNILRQVVFPPSEVGTLWTVALFFVTLAVSAAIVLLGHRIVRSRT